MYYVKESDWSVVTAYHPVSFLYFFIVTTANLHSNPKGAISKWEGGYDGKEESSIDDTPKCPLGAGGRS